MQNTTYPLRNVSGLLNELKAVYLPPWILHHPGPLQAILTVIHIPLILVNIYPLLVEDAYVLQRARSAQGQGRRHRRRYTVCHSG